MEILILNSILFKELMPWTFDVKDFKVVNEKLKKVGSKDPETETQLVQHLQILLADYTDLSKWLTTQNFSDTSPLKNHCFEIEFPEFTDTITKFYSNIISLETLRVYNAFNTKIQKYNNKVDIVYHTNIALKNIKALTVNTVKEIKERGFEDSPNENSPLSHFVLQLLRQHLTMLFFDIQELSKASIDNPISIEDFYLIDLQLPKSLITEIHKIEPEEQSTKSGAKENKLSFGFKGDNQALINVVKQLCLRLDFLKEDITPQNTFIMVLTSKDLKEIKSTVQIDCATNEFQLIAENLKKLANKFTPTNIEKSKLFITKEGNRIDSNLLYVTKNKSKLSKEKKDEINAIFQNINNQKG